MHTPTIRSYQPAPVVPAKGTPADAKPAEGAILEAPSTRDSATISQAGHEALKHEGTEAPSPTQIAQASAARASKAVQLGKSLLQSNPAKYQQADPDGDGKLTVAEAKSAGLMA